MQLTRYIAVIACLISLLGNSSAYADNNARHKRVPKLVTIKRQDPTLIPDHEKEQGVDWRDRIALRASTMLEEKFSFSIDGYRYIATRDPTNARGSYKKKTSAGIDEVITGKVQRYAASGKSAGSAGEYTVARVTSGKRTVTTAVFTSSKGSFSIQSSEGVGEPVSIARHFNPKLLRKHECETKNNPGDRSAMDIPSVQSAAVQKPVIKVLLAYTAGALGKLYDPSIPNSMADAVLKLKSIALIDIARMNAHMKNSGVNAVTELTCEPYALQDYGAQPLDFLEKNGAKTAASYKGDGIWDEIHDKRAECAADLVLIYPYFGGVSHILKFPYPEAGRHAFMATYFNDTANPSDFIFNHEGGHALGLSHEPANGLGNGFAWDSNGHVFFGPDGNKYVDIMNSSADYLTSTPIPYYSNPDKTYKGVPVGVEGLSNGAKTLRFTTPIGALFAENLIYADKDRHTFQFHIERFPDSPVVHLVLQHTSTDVPEIAYTNDIKILSEVSEVYGGYAEFPYSTPDMRTEIYGSGEFQALLYPDVYVISPKFKTPSWGLGSITISNSNGSMTGQVIDAQSGTPLTASGDWLTVQYQPDGSDTFSTINFLGTDSEGRFSMPLTYNGVYRVSYRKTVINESRTTSNNLFFLSGTNPESAIPTPTVNAIPNVVPPTPTLVVIPAETPTATPTATPKPGKPEVVFQLNTPNYVGSFVELIAHVTRKSGSGYVPLTNKDIKFRCDSKSGSLQKTYKSNDKGLVRTKFKAPLSEIYICAWSYEQFRSEKIKVEPK